MTAHFPFLVNAASLFSARIQDTSPITSPKHSQIRAEEPKPPVSETHSWTMISNRDDSSMIVTDDPAIPGHGQGQGRVSSPLLRGPGPSQHDHDKNHHEPPIYDTPHVDLTPIPVQGAMRPSSPRSDPSGGKPTLPKILTATRLESRNSDSPRTAFYTPGGSVEVVDSRPFDSAVNVRVVYSGSSPHSRDVAGRRVVGVHQPSNTQLDSKYFFPIQPLEPPRRNSKTTDIESRHGFTTLLTRPTQNTRERQGDSAFSYSSSPFDEFQRDVGSSGRIPGGRDERDDTRGNKETMLPRRGRKRAAPKLDGGYGRSEVEHKEIGEERDDHSYVSASTDYVPISNEVEGHSRDQDPAQVSST